MKKIKSYKFGKMVISILAIALSASLIFTGCSGKVDEPVDNKPDADASTGDTIKVGILHSLSGTMAIRVSLKSRNDAIEEIMHSGVLVKK